MIFFYFFTVPIQLIAFYINFNQILDAHCFCYISIFIYLFSSFLARWDYSFLSNGLKTHLFYFKGSATCITLFVCHGDVGALLFMHYAIQ